MAYGQYRVVTIDHTKVPTTQTNFTVGIIGTYSYLATIANGGKVNNTVTFNGQTVPADLKITSDINGNTLLNWEIASYNATTGQIEIWVQIASLDSSSDTVIYLWYGDSGTSTYTGGSVGAAWDGNYVGVYHLADGSSLSAKDSTQNLLNFTNSGATAGTGKIDGGAVFGGTDYCNIGTPGAISTLQCPMTISGWFFTATSSGNQTILGQYLAVSGGQLPKLVRIDSGVLNYYTTTAAGFFQSVAYSGAPSLSNWHYVAIKIGGSLASPTINISIDNSNQTLSLTALDSSPASFVSTRIGGNENAPSADGFKGTLDEIRISNFARSADWETVCYNNQNSPSTFYSVGSEVSVGGITPITLTISDTETFSDSIDLFLNLGNVFGDTVTFSDTIDTALGAITGSSFTRADVRLKITNFFNNPAYYQAFDFNDSIQDGMDEIVAFSGCHFKTALLPFTKDLTYYDMLTLIPDLIGIIAIYNGTTKRWMVPTSSRKLDNFRPDWETAAGTPEFFWPVNHRYVAIYRKPHVDGYGNMYIFYRASNPTLDDTTPLTLPIEYSQLIEAYVKTDLQEQNQEFSKAMKHFIVYQQQMSKLYNLVHSKRQMDRLPSI